MYLQVLPPDQQYIEELLAETQPTEEVSRPHTAASGKVHPVPVEEPDQTNTEQKKQVSNL